MSEKKERPRHTTSIERDPTKPDMDLKRVIMEKADKTKPEASR